MASKVKARKKYNDNLDNEKLSNDIDAISETLYLDKSKSSSSVLGNRPKSADKANATMPNLKSKSGIGDPLLKDKKSIWNWKPLKALSHVRNRRFNCGFTLEVHRIEGLPDEFNGLSLSVHWKRRDGEVVTRPIKVVEGVAEFEEKLIHTCSVYGSRSGPRHSAKYEAKHFLLYAAAYENPKLDLGKHRVDLTRLFPLTLEELEGEKSSGTWTTSFKLLGNANGAVMNVSFGYVVLGDNAAPTNKNVLKLLDSTSAGRSHTKSNSGDGNNSIQHTGSLPLNQKPSLTSRSVDDCKVLRKVSPVRMCEFSSSVSALYQRFDDKKSNSLLDDKCEIALSADDDVEPDKPSSYTLDISTGISDDENEHAEYSVIDKGVEFSLEKPGLDQNGVNFVDQPMVGSPDLIENDSRIQSDVQEEPHFMRDEGVVHDMCSEREETCTKESLLEDLVSVLGHVANLEKEALETPEDTSELSDWENEVEDKSNEMIKQNLDDHAESVANPEKETLYTPELKSESSYREIEAEDKPKGMTQSNFDDLEDSVADDFLSMRGGGDSPISSGSDAEPESPRERLLREFQKEAEASGFSLFGFEIDEEVMADYEEEDAVDCCYHAPTASVWEEFSPPSDIFPVVEPESPEIRAKVISEYPKIRAKVMEDLEIESTIQESGLNENAFMSSLTSSDDDSVIFINPSPKERSPLPPLGRGLGSFMQTKTGGFLRSMNPALFNNAKSGGSLIMQTSSPVVVPAELGSGVMEILQNLASVGLEQLSVQAYKLMPLEEISGKTMQQIACESADIEGSKRHDLLQDVIGGGCVISTEKKLANGDFTDQKLKKVNSKTAADELHASLEDLAPLAMDKIGALSVEGLRIQYGMEEEEAPSNISTPSTRDISTLRGKRASPTRSVGLEGAVGLQLLNVKDSGDDHADGLMGLSLTLDEWMKLDSGEIDEDEQMSERTSRLLAAHHADCTDLNILGKKQVKASGRRCGLLGNNLTVALMVQLHDPLRNYEPVGTPMLALIQAEKVFLPPKPKLYSTVAERRDYDDDEEDEPASADEEDTEVELNKEKAKERELISQYKINEVHVAGLKVEPSKKKPWGSAAQQQSGSRWLLANGMGKANKHPLMKSKVTAKSSSLPGSVTPQPGDTLWSISSRFLGNGSQWKELATQNPHIRNPNVILPNETIRLW